MPKRKKDVVLPRLPSALIQISLHDLAETERLKTKYKIDMSDWVAKQGGGKCAVCLAGAVMVRRLGAKPTRDADVYPSDFKKNERQINAINHLREGEVVEALHELGISVFETNNREITDYHENKAVFKKQMKQLASELEAEGL